VVKHVIAFAMNLFSDISTKLLYRRATYRKGTFWKFGVVVEAFNREIACSQADTAAGDRHGLFPKEQARYIFAKYSSSFKPFFSLSMML